MILTLIAGVVLLLAGRQVYWLMVGLLGFVLGYSLTAELLQGPGWLVLVVGLVAGILASGLAVFFQRVVLTVAGLLIGGGTVFWLAGQMSWGEPWWLWLLDLAGAAEARRADQPTLCGPGRRRSRGPVVRLQREALEMRGQFR